MFRKLFSKEAISEFITRKRKLQSDILFASLSILSISILLIITHTYRTNTSTIVTLAQDYMTSSTNKLKERVTDVIISTEEIARIYSTLLSDIDLEQSKNQITLFNAITASLETNQQVSTVFLGTPEGTFYEFLTPKTVAQYINKLGLQIPENTNLIIKEIINKNNNHDKNVKGNVLVSEASDIWYYVTDNKNLSEPYQGEKTSYDPRKRDWYINSTKTQNLIWSDVYVFIPTFSKNANQAESGVTVSKSVFDKDGKFKGVFGVDITLKSFSDFLIQSPISPNSHTYIINSAHQIVASSSLKSNIKIKEAGVSLIKAEDLGDHLLSKALEMNRGAQEKVVSFIENGKEYVAVFASFEKRFQNDWKVVVVSPMEDFVWKITKERNMILLSSLIIFIVSFSLTYYLARRISEPIVMLAHEAHKIQDLDLHGKVNIHSNIKEISELTHAMANLKNTMQSFSYYIPKTLVKKLINRKQSVHVGGRTKDVTLMFTDIEGFTSVSENLSAEKLVTYLSEYFEELSKIIMDCNGTVDKYIGDAIMAFWGAPIPDRHHVHNACRAALLCQRRLHTLNRIWKREGRPVFNTRIGLHTGEVVIGNMGSSERMNYTAIGDNVNTCARLEGLNKFYGTNIMVSESIYDLAKDHFLFRHLDNIVVKGKTKAVRIFELVAQTKGDNSLLPTDEQFEFTHNFEKAYKLFLTRQWREAHEAFERLKPPSINDKTVDMYIKRCNAYISEPPPSEWEGDTVMHEK